MSKKEICKYAIISPVDNSKLAYTFKVECCQAHNVKM